MSSYADKITQYCADVVSGKIVAGVYTKKAVKRYLSDLKRQKDADFNFEYNQEAADTLCAFAEALKPADLNGKPLKLLPWQIFCLSNLEGWVYKSDRTRKRFRTGYIEVNRKNGKTTGLLYPLVLFNFIKYPASESYLISSRDDLAEKTFKEIKMIIEADEALTERCTCRSLAVTYMEKGAVADASRIGFFCDGGKSADGFRPRFFCIDEYHEYATDAMLTSMQYGMRSKKDAQGVMITTADANINVPCYEQNLKSKRILNGLQSQDDFFCIIYAIDENDDYKNPACWQKANPSLYDIIEPEVIASDIQDAELTPARIPELKAKTFGVWGGGGLKTWLPLEVFQQHKDDALTVGDFAGEVCFAGLDLSQIDDMTAYTKVFNRNGLWYFFHRFYIPEATAFDRYRRENVNFFAWIESGLITATPGNTVDYDYIAHDILDDASRYRLLALGYDRWQSHDVIDNIEEENPNILLVEVEQSLKKLSPITKAYEKAIKDALVVDNNPVMAWMINNAEVRPDANGNYKPMKPSKASTRRIDGVISSLNAYAMATNPEINQPAPSLSFNDIKSLF